MGTNSASPTQASASGVRTRSYTCQPTATDWIMTARVETTRTIRNSLKSCSR